MRKVHWAILVGLIAVVVIGLIIFISGRLFPSDAPVAGAEDTFPRLAGTNLLLQSVTVPDDLEGQLRLIVVAYDESQQVFVEKWLRPLEALIQDYPDLHGYYVPLLPQDASNAALAIIGGMTVAASGDEDRARTVVVFTDVDAFNQILDIPGVDALQLFLLDENGTILWHGSGNYDPLTLESLQNALKNRA